MNLCRSLSLSTLSLSFKALKNHIRSSKPLLVAHKKNNDNNNKSLSRKLPAANQTKLALLPLSTILQKKKSTHTTTTTHRP
jgi:hypothetical protein